MRSLLESLPDSSSSSGCRSIPDSIIAENIGGELSLGLRETCTGSAVVAMDLGQHEEVSESSSREAESDEKDNEANEVVTASCTVKSGTTAEGDNSSDDATATSARNAKSHDHGEAELTEEDEKEDHEVKT